MPSIKTALVICLCWVSRLTANPLYRTKEVDSVPAKEIHLLHRSEPKTVPNTNGKLCSSSDRLCKLHRRTQDFYIWKARPLEVILPLHHSAPLFWEFYIAIITQVSKQWSLQAPLPSFWIKQGTLELLFKPVGGPIPWSVVARFAYNILSATQLERIGKSRITDQNGAAKLAVGVTQQIANNQSSKARTVGVARRTSSTKLGPIRLTSFKIHAGIVPVSAAAPCR